ncbi:hypothetical protein IFM89_033396 [Coptis chinensis]|uniref:Uncharacterized protein n=1 Tax=Coptis chinensis TaxID=261450 RepID=A0A835HYJ6_9MAGN|nr:hypothetical protein IFM89_033396 [Coptis chinensis]
MMQSRLAVLRISSSLTHKRVPLWIRNSTTTSRTAEPNVHAGDTAGVDAEQAVRHVLALQQQQKKPNEKGTELYQQPTKPTPGASSPKIVSSPVVNPLDPTKQQKKHYAAERTAIEDVSCVGVDGFPSNDDYDRKKQEENDREYYKHHKPSPLSELELADTRKPIRRATDGTVTNKVQGGEGEVIVWREEQLESAEETMLKAMRIWKESEMRGDPTLPHSKVVREILSARGEYPWDLEKDDLNVI